MARLYVREHGFVFGAMQVEAVAAVERRSGEGETTVIAIKTDAGEELEVYCSPRGRRLRVFRRGKGELVEKEGQ